MNSLPKRLAILGGIVGFCAAQLLSMLRGVPPLNSMRKAIVCALVLAALCGLCTRIAVSVFHEGLSESGEGR
jgi:hypothetical protein